MTGYSVRQRRLYVVTLQQQAANSAVAEERLRIARELHDVVAHSMSVIAVQAGYGQYVIDAARTTRGTRSARSRPRAGTRSRRCAGCSACSASRTRRRPPRRRLRPAQAGRPRCRPSPLPAAAGRPQPPGRRRTARGRRRSRPHGHVRAAPPAPGLARLDRLIERTRGAGVRVTLEVSGQPRAAPAGVDLSAYRIIQEALTNVVRHAGTGAACVVSLGYSEADLVIRVTDDGGPPVPARPRRGSPAPATGSSACGSGCTCAAALSPPGRCLAAVRGHGDVAAARHRDRDGARGGEGGGAGAGAGGEGRERGRGGGGGGGGGRGGGGGGGGGRAAAAGGQ